MKQIFRAATYAAALATSFISVPALAQPAPPPPAAPVPGATGASIAAVVNGQVVTDADVMARARLLAVSTGMPLTTDALARMKPQIIKLLVDQTLQMQEINRRAVIVPEPDIEASIAHIEQGNNMQPGMLRGKLEAAGVPFSTLVSQIRTELGWQSVLHQVLGQDLQPTPGDMNAEKKALATQMNSAQYHIAEIFIPVPDPADEQTAKTFANAVIAQLRTGAPFPVIAAQFSQNSSALQGGDLGFVSPIQLDPATAAVVTTMPVGAISNPIRVPGGYDIVQLQEVHQPGGQSQVVLSIRQAFAAYPVITNGTVGPAQGAVIEKLVTAGKNVHSCQDMEALNTAMGNIRPADPGPVVLAQVTPPQFQALLTTLPIGQPSRPLIAADGVSIVVVCTRQTQAAGLPADKDIGDMIIERRVDLESQQLLDNLHHSSIITQH